MLKDFPKNINWKSSFLIQGARRMHKLKIINISDPNNIIIFDKEFISHGKAWSYLYNNKLICMDCKIRWKLNLTGAPCRQRYLFIDSINLHKCKTLKDYLIWQEFEYK